MEPRAFVVLELFGISVAPRSALRRTSRTFSRPSRFTCSNAPTKSPPRASPNPQSAHPCTLHKSSIQHMTHIHCTPTHTSCVQHSHIPRTITTHLAAPAAQRIAGIACHGHSLALLPHTRHCQHTRSTAHGHTTRRTRAAHDGRTHHDPTPHTWPHHHHHAELAPPPPHVHHTDPAAYCM